MRIVPDPPNLRLLAIARRPRHIRPFLPADPDTRALTPSVWERRSDLVGVDMRESEQLALLETLRARFGAEYDALPWEPTSDPTQFHLANPQFTSVDAEVL